MRQRFFMFVQCKPGKTYEVGQAILAKKLEYVADISSISGKWDLLLRIEIDSRKDVAREIVGPISEVDGIKRTKTIVAYEVYNPDDVYFEED